MTNNDVMRRIRYIFDFSDSEMMQLFASTDTEVTRWEVSAWMKQEDDADFKELVDVQLATFLNGLINNRRGKKEGPQPEPEAELNNNIIMRKLKIALNYQAEDMLAILALAGVKMSKHELSAFFRKPDHKHFRECQNQVLRNFLMGLQLKFRGKSEE